MTKFLILFSSFLLTLFLFVSPIKAQEQFSVNATVTYKVDDTGKTLVTHDITLENLFSTLYATTYTLSFENIETKNIKAYDEKGKEIPSQFQKNGDKAEIKLTFPDAVVGKGAKRHFLISYENSNFAVKTGEVWEVSIPRLTNPDAFGNYTVNLDIPASFGLEAYISPKPQSSVQNGSGKTYSFSKDDIVQTGITAGFGQFQVFSFSLSYHLENPLAVSSQTQVALPPDTAFQKVYLQKIDPKPETVLIDKDGNWLASYKLAPRQRIDVIVNGSVQIFASYRKFPQPSPQILSDNLKESEYWQVNDPQIKALAAQLKTPQAIYDYVSKNLKYDTARVQPNVQRMGAIKALANPTQAICMEFTDLFISIARAAGIPAREVNGYAYTENPQLQPLGLVADVLHSWPEYYDSDSHTWIPVDPTWGSTTGGVDFFSKLDLRHFAFVLHGESAVQPYPPGSYKLGPNPQKDVFVSFGKLPENRISIPELTLTSKSNLPFMASVYTVSIKNPGPEALYSLYPTVYFDKTEHSRDFLPVLTPYSKYPMQIRVPFSLLGKDTPDVIKVEVDGKQIEIPTNKNQEVINSLISIFIVFVILIFLVLIRLKKITFVRLTATIQGIYDKFTKKPPQNPGIPTGIQNTP